MSLDQANAFRDYVAQNDDVQREIRSALMTESAKVSERIYTVSRLLQKKVSKLGKLRRIMN